MISAIANILREPFCRSARESSAESAAIFMMAWVSILTGIAFITKVHEKRLAEQQVPEAADAAKIVQLVNDAILKTKELSRGLLPVVSEAHGLMSALRMHASEVEDLFGIECRFECNESVLIHDAAVATHLYRIGQEAVNNAVKHSKARSIVIQLGRSENEGMLTIKDDGVGIEVPLPPHTGAGLQIMHYRGNVIGGNRGNPPRASAGNVCNLPISSRRKRISLR